MKLQRFTHTARNDPYSGRARAYEGEPYVVIGYQVGKLIVQRSFYAPFYCVTNMQGRVITPYWGMPLQRAIAFAKCLQSGGLDYTGEKKDLTERHKSRYLSVKEKFRDYCTSSRDM